MNYELSIRAEHVSIEDVTGKEFLDSMPSVGSEIVGRVKGELFAYGWDLDNPDENWRGMGVLGVRVDRRASLLQGRPVILPGVGEWLPEERNKNV